MKAISSGSRALLALAAMSALPGLHTAQYVISPSAELTRYLNIAQYYPVQKLSLSASLSGADTRHMAAQAAGMDNSVPPTVFDLACPDPEFSGYFAPERWMYKELKTEASSALEGLWVRNGQGAEVLVANGRYPVFQILAPADGYIAFSWESEASEPLSEAPFALRINQKPVAVLNHTRTPFMRAGDVLVFEWKGTACAAQIREFRFLSNAAKVEEYSWSNGTGQEIRQLITHPQVGLDAARFPASLQERVKDTSPKYTGYPFLDMTELRETGADQLPLVGGVAGMHADWEDEYVICNGQYGILRHWKITQSCKGNVMLGKQFIPIARPEQTDTNPSFDE